MYIHLFYEQYVCTYDDDHRLIFTSETETAS